MVQIQASTTGEQVACPGCAILSGRVHSRYERRLLDTAVTGRELLIRLRVRRLFCDNAECVRKTFAEQVPGLAARYARRTSVLDRVLCAVALALGGRAGARLTQRLAAQHQLNMTRIAACRPPRAGDTDEPRRSATPLPCHRVVACERRTCYRSGVISPNTGNFTNFGVRVPRTQNYPMERGLVAGQARSDVTTEPDLL
ncbi:transposase family protein [Saccharopolyspora sp. NPDC050389]|uniref:transposase family protein n=1 Tax=Saccharopolyspora sp. NPDC050389 TaxID=3155516 RepID=UPI0033E47661